MPLFLKGFFLDRGYPDTLLEEALSLASSKDRPTPLLPKELGALDREKVFFTTTFHPHEHHLRKMVLF